MSGRFFNGHTVQGSNGKGFESAAFCASFFAALILLVDTVLAVSIFVSADILVSLGGILAFVLVFIILSVLLLRRDMRRSKPSAA